MDVRLPDGTIIKNVPDGTTKADLVAKLQNNGMAVPSEWLQAAPQSQPVQETGRAINRGLSDIPRQLGLTARYALEGPAQAAQVFTEPIAGLMRMGGIPTKPLGVVAAGLADSIGLPRPETAQERVVGDATRLVAGAGTTGPMLKATGAIAEKAANAAPGMWGFARDRLLAAGPAMAEAGRITPQVLASAGGAGLMGGLSREGGGTELQQATSALIGGVVGGMAPGAANAALTAGRKLLNAGMTPQAMDIQISGALQRAGMDYSQVPERARQAMRAEMAGALKAGRELDPEAVRRLAEFRTLGVTPTRGMVTQDPVQITREMNLAKIGANSADGELQGLARVQNQNNARLIQVMNEQGASRGNAAQAGDALTSSVIGRRDALRSAEQAAWDAAKSSPGYRAPVSAQPLSAINAALGDEGLMPFMNPTISRYMEAFQTGQQPFTPQAYRNLQSMLSREVAKGGNEGAAAGLAQRILRDADLRPAGFADTNNTLVTQGVAARMRAADAAADDAISAVNRARQATRQAYAYEDSSPLVRSVLSGGASSDPERIATRYIIGGTANEARDVLAQLGPQGSQVVKDALIANLKEKALSGSADEVGKFSQSAFNRALNKIGDRKLSLLFTEEELGRLRMTGRVASYMQNQPVGSAVNNSNSGSLVVGQALDMLRNVPILGPNIGQPLQNLNVSIQQRSAQNVLPGLLAAQPKQPLLPGLIAPGIGFSGGLLSAPAGN